MSAACRGVVACSYDRASWDIELSNLGAVAVNPVTIYPEVLREARHLQLLASLLRCVNFVQKLVEILLKIFHTIVPENLKVSVHLYSVHGSGARRGRAIVLVLAKRFHRLGSTTRAELTDQVVVNDEFVDECDGYTCTYGF